MREIAFQLYAAISEVPLLPPSPGQPPAVESRPKTKDDDIFLPVTGPSARAIARFQRRLLYAIVGSFVALVIAIWFLVHLNPGKAKPEAAPAPPSAQP